MMKSILTLSGLALVLSAHSALADPAHPLDPHEQARQLILSATQHSVTTFGTAANTAPEPTDPHALARQHILASPVAGGTFHPTLAKGALPAIDSHEHARRTILGSAGERL